MSALAVAPPQIASGQPVTPGMYAVDRPMTLSQAVPTLASGLALANTTTGTLDASISKLTFGALLYRLNFGGTVDVFDGKSSWVPEAAFDPTSPTLIPYPYVFDATSKTWLATFVAYAIKEASQSAFWTDHQSLIPRYGFLTLLNYANGAMTHVAASNRTPPFGLTSSSSATRIAGGALVGLNSTQDIGAADGLLLQVNDVSGNPVATVRISSNTSVSPAVLVALKSPAVSLGLNWDGSAIVTATTVVLTGELHAQKIRYLPSGGGPETYL